MSLAVTDVDVTTTDGVRLVVRCHGSGPPVLALHGSGGGLDSWAPVAEHLPYQVWTPARRGHAPSGTPDPDGGLPAEVADVGVLLEHVVAATGTATVPLLTGSYGSVLALHVARAGHPRLGPLVLFEPPLFARGPVLDAPLRRYRELVAADDLPAAADVFAAEVARMPAAMRAALASAPPPAAQARRAAVGFDRDLAALAADHTAVVDFAGVDDAPVLLLQGGDTWAPMPAAMDGLAAVLPRAERVVLAGHAHFATHTAPDAFAGAVTRFLARSARRPR